MTHSSVARSFVERWFAEDATCDVYWNDALARFQVVSGERVVFEAPALVEVLRWGMGLSASAMASVHDDEGAIELVSSAVDEPLVPQKF